MTMRSKIGIFLVLLSLSHSSNSSNTRRKKVCVVPSTDDHLLGQSCETDSHVTNIANFCEENEYHSQTIATILEGVQTLNSTCEFKNAADLTLTSSMSNGSAVIINCTPSSNTGLVFLNVSLLTISAIQFTGCGLLYTTNQSQLDGLTAEIFAALLFVDGSTLTLRKVFVTDSKSAGIYIYNVANNVTLDACRVTNATSKKQERMGGNVIAYDKAAKNEKTTILISRSYFASCGYTDSQRCLKDHIRSHSSGLSAFIGNPTTVLYVIDTQLSSNIYRL